MSQLLLAIIILTQYVHMGPSQLIYIPGINLLSRKILGFMGN